MNERIISAWVYNPDNNLFGDKGGRAARFRITCQNPEGCDIFTKQNSCVLTGALSSCRFGKKTRIDGPTKRSMKFRSWMAEQKTENAEHIGKLDSLKAWNRIAFINGFYWLPYSHMKPSFLSSGSRPVDSEWIAQEDMTAELLARICRHVPSGFGGPIPSYQKEVVPKFISDLHMFYPALFDLLPDDQKARMETITGVGRKADLTTCEPGEYVIGTNRWHWDGEKLTGGTMLFQPVPGECIITIKPDAGATVTITDAAQVGQGTVFLD